MQLLKKTIRMKDIPGYQGIYAVTDDGRVWSYGRNKYLKPDGNKARVDLYKNNINEPVTISYLVASAFVPNDDPEKNTIVIHLDGNALNNNYYNLQWSDTKAIPKQDEMKCYPIVDRQELKEYRNVKDIVKATGLDLKTINQELLLGDLGRTTRFKHSDKLTSSDIKQLMRDYYGEEIIKNNKYTDLYKYNSNPDSGFMDRFFSENIIYPAVKNKPCICTEKTELSATLTLTELEQLQRILSNGSTDAMSNDDKAFVESIMKFNDNSNE